MPQEGPTDKTNSSFIVTFAGGSIESDHGDSINDGSEKDRLAASEPLDKSAFKDSGQRYRNMSKNMECGVDGYQPVDDRQNIVFNKRT